MITLGGLDKKRFANLLGICIVPAVLEHAQVDAGQIDSFYRSRLYALLEDSDTGLWHFSPRLLAQMYKQEQESGSFDIPEACA